MSGRRLTSTPAVRASLPRWSGLGRGNLGTLALLIAALALPACVVEPTDEGDVGVELEESADFLEIGVPDVPDDDGATDPEQQLGEPQPTPWRTRADGDGDPTPPDGCGVGVSGTGTAKDDE